jgi:hypothetical protein
MIISDPQTLLCPSAGIDYVTCTTKPGMKDRLIMGLVPRWFAQRESEGYHPAQWSFNSYVGETIDGLSYGQRHDGSIVRLSSEMARIHGRTVLRLANHVSRLDVQVTLTDDCNGMDWAAWADQEARHDKRIESGVTRSSLRHDTPDGAMFTLGSRVSERYYRIYDKSAESKGVWPSGTWRWEVEYKNARAGRVAQHLATDAWSGEACRGLVSDAFADYGIVVPSSPLPRNWRDHSPREETTDERRLLWLETTIRPAVARLREAFSYDRLLTALGLDDVDLATGEIADEQQKGDDIVHAPYPRRGTQSDGDPTPSGDFGSGALRGPSVPDDEDRPETRGPTG